MIDNLKQKLEAGSRAILTLTGIYSEPKKGARSAGVSRMGAPVYTSEALANSKDLTAGNAVLSAFVSLVTPFNVLDKKEKEAIKRVEKESGNPKLIQVLDEEHANRNGERFIVTILKAAGANGRHALGVLAGTKLYDHWGVMSPAQKSIGIAVLSIQTHKTSEGGPVCDLKIIDGKDQTLYVRDALDLFVQGKNPYPLVEYWDQIYRLFRVYGEKPSPEIMSDFAATHKLIGISIKGAAVPGVSKEVVNQQGGKPTPQYGVGALAIPKGKAPPQGYSKTAQMEGGDLISPNANIKSAAGALGGSLAGTKAGANGISQDAVGVYKKWKGEDKKQANKGEDGGSQLIAGLTALKQNSPHLYGALVAFITHFTHDKISLSNPIEYASCLAGIALARLVTGKKEDIADKEGLALTRQIHDSTPGEFAKIQINIRALYANFGVSSKADAYQLTNQAYAEDRINESDLVAMHEIFDIIYEAKGLTEVEKLMNGASKGLEIVRDKTPLPMNRMTKGQSSDHKEVLAQMTKDELRQKNQARYVKRAAQNAPQAANQAQPIQGGGGNPTPEAGPAATEPPPQNQMGATP